NFLRLYMVPGMQHCGLGPGPDSFGAEPTANEDPRKSIFASLMLWVENGIAPQAIIATKYVDPLNPKSGTEMSRPLCPYPQVVKYKGTGNIHDAANFGCTLER